MARPPSPPLVLIVDDDQDARDMYAEFLLFSDFGIVKARNGMEGFTRACETQPDVIVTDLALPSIDGLEFVRRLRGDERTRDIPVVVVTGCTVPAVQETARQLGCDSLLIKPCLPAVLIDKIQRLLATTAAPNCVSTASRGNNESSPEAIWRDPPARTTS
jgi:two-component system cell cycle response regulator DivK